MLNAGVAIRTGSVLYPAKPFSCSASSGLEECARSSEYGEEMIGLAGIPEKKRIATRFTQFLMKHAGSPGMALLKDTYDYLVNEKGVDENDLVHEWAEGVIGDQYPVPDRILKYTEVLVERYLKQELCDKPPAQRGSSISLLPKGGTAAMCYIFRFSATKISFFGKR